MVDEMDIDPELRDKIIQTHTDMRWVRSKLESGSETFKDHDERLRKLEQNQSRAMGVVVAIGSIITLLMNLAIQIWDKIRWK